MRVAEVRSLRPLRSAVAAVLVTAALAAVVGAATFLIRPTDTSPDLGRLPVTGSEIVVQVGVVVAVFLVAWVVVMVAGLARRDRR